MSIVTIHFGPYEAHGIIRHKTQRLHGILSELNKLGYEVELLPSRFLNFLQIDFNNKKIFRGDITYLSFNLDCEDDPVAMRIINCIEDAKRRFDAEDNVPKFTLKGAVPTTDTRELISPSIELLYEIPMSWENMLKEKLKEGKTEETTQLNS